VLTELEERIDPPHTALLVVDMQNDFCSEGGMIARLGNDVSAAKGIAPRLNALIEAARDAGVLVVFIKNRSRADGAYNAPPDLLRRLTSYAKEEDLLITEEGSWGEEIIDELRRAPQDVIVIKHRPDAFERTQLGLVLRSNGIASVVVTGTATFACVESTARRALMEDLYVTVVADCVASTDEGLQEASLRVMRAFFGDDAVCTSDRLTAAWGRPPAAGSTLD
jgi:nicotinamidase-related amidase